MLLFEYSLVTPRHQLFPLPTAPQSIVAGVVVTWLPALDHTRTALPKLVDVQTVYYQRKGRLLAISPTPPPVVMTAIETRRRAWKQNPVIVAMKLQEQLEALPEQTHGALAKQVGISRGRVCQYLRLLKLPEEIIRYMADPSNQTVVAGVTEQALHDLFKLSSQHIPLTFHALLTKSSGA